MHNEEIFYINDATFLSKDTSNHILDLTLKHHPNFGKEKLHSFEKPVIMIAGFGYNGAKFETLLTLDRYFRMHDIKISGITYNQLGLLFDYYTFSWTKNIVFPNIVYEINDFFYKILSKDTSDLVILNLPGSMNQMSAENSFQFGMLHQAYLKAVSVDICILALNPSVTIDSVEKQVQILKLNGVGAIAFTVSPISYDSDSIHQNLKYFSVDDNKLVTYIKSLQEKYPYPVVRVTELEKDQLGEYILTSLL